MSFSIVRYLRCSLEQRPGVSELLNRVPGSQGRRDIPGGRHVSQSAEALFKCIVLDLTQLVWDGTQGSVFL